MTLVPDPARSDVIDRALGWLIALGGCILILDQTLIRLDRLADFAPWWNGGALLVIAGIVVLAIFGMLLPMAVLTVCWRMLPLAYAAFQATWLAGFHGDDVDSAMPWLWTVEPAAITLLLLTFRPAVAVGIGLAFSLIPAAASLVVLGHLPHTVAVQTPHQLGNVVYLAIFIGVRLQLERLHAGEREARRQRQRQVRVAARLERHAALARLVHDEVLSSLSAAMHADGTPAELLRRDARQAIEVLSLSTDLEPDEDTPLRSEETLTALTTALRRIDAGFTLETDCAPGRHPGKVVREVTLAAAEALRNSLRHAGTSASQRVRITLSENLIRVSVRDDGVGFVPDPRSPRLGVRRSILGRMADLGGSARIDSVPGRGTEVILTWPT